jgi:hypothetical protein
MSYSVTNIMPFKIIVRGFLHSSVGFFGTSKTWKIGEVTEGFLSVSQFPLQCEIHCRTRSETNGLHLSGLSLIFRGRGIRLLKTGTSLAGGASNSSLSLRGGILPFSKIRPTAAPLCP